MRRACLFVYCWMLMTALPAQTISQRLQKAYQEFESDSQLRHAISSLYVIDAATGKVVFEKNAQVGLAPASTQKIVTASTAFELLGKDFRYKTEFGITAGPEKSMCLWIGASGDPTLGSWRWGTTEGKYVMDQIIKQVNKADLQNCAGIFVTRLWNGGQIPDGWIWQDIGNYYGAGASALNWRENQYDLYLASGNKAGEAVNVVETVPHLHSQEVTSEAVAAKKGSGDNAYIYFPSVGNNLVVRGTIPAGESRFKISGSIPNPVKEFIETLQDSLRNRFEWKPTSSPFIIAGNWPLAAPMIFYNHYSPSLDSIIYWFLQRSINLYGEALVKTFVSQKLSKNLPDTNLNFSFTDSGVAIVKQFWQDKGLDIEELNLYDGSGLSPLNRITTHAQVEILKYAKTRDWFSSFYNALPEYNGMKMKSGTISDVKGFCGYQKSKDGHEYIFSFLVNNYSGKTSGVVNKMYKVLDELK